MADAGFDDILISFPLVGAAKIERLAALAERMKRVGRRRLGRGRRELSAVLARHGARSAFLVECDTGGGRTGVQTPEEAAELAALVAGSPGLRFAG